MRKLVALGVIVGALGVLDFGTKLWAQGRIEHVAEEEAPEADAEADIDALPFLPPLFASGSVDHVDLVLRDVGAGRVRFDRLAFSLDGVKVSRGALFREREVQLVSIDRGTITAELALDDVTRVLGQELPEGELQARVVGRSLQVAGVVTVPLPVASLLPCEGDVRVTSDSVVVSCTVTEIPPGLLEAAT